MSYYGINGDTSHGASNLQGLNPKSFQGKLLADHNDDHHA